MSKIEPIMPTSHVIEEDSIDLSEYIGMFIENRWLIGLVTLASFLIGLLYSINATPIYRADALLQIEEKSQGWERTDDLESLLSGESSSVVTEIEIVTSRKVIGEMVDNLNLTMDVKPKYFPFVGERLAKRYQGNEPAQPWLWFDSYAWGGEVLKIDRISLPGNLTGKTFTLEKRKKDSYALLLDNELVLEGNVGQVAETKKGAIQVYISKFIARPDTQVYVTKKSRLSRVSHYQSAVKASEKGRSKTGIMQITLDGDDRNEIVKILNEVARSYLKQNVRRHSEESENMLTFISGQLPELKKELSVAEFALNKHRENKGTIDLSYESQNLIQSITDIEKTISELKIEKAELLNKLTVQHPIIQGINEKLAKLIETREQLENKVAKLPETELESVKFSRDVKVANELYMLLLNKSQELKVAKAGTIGSVRVIDTATATETPIRPKKGQIIIIGIILGFIVGLIIAVIKKALNKTIHDPKVIENLGIPVYAEIPFSVAQSEMDKKNKNDKKKKYDLLVKSNTDEHVLESLRSLRTSIQFAMMESDNNVIMISGPSPGIGKTFVSANFSYLLSDIDNKVLLIDADMRKGHISAYFDFENTPGLSEVISGASSFDDVVHKQVDNNSNIDVITAGTYPPNPSELLMSDSFGQMLDSVKTDYDLIIIDTPPILAVTDAAIVARYSLANFIVLRSEYHLVRDVEMTLKRFEHNGVTIKGAIFNGIALRDQKYGYGYKYYGYKYSYK